MSKAFFKSMKTPHGELDFLRYSVKGCSAGVICLLRCCQHFEKCLFKISGIREESLVRLLLLSGPFNLPTDLHFLLQRSNNSFMPCHVFYILLKLLLKKAQ